MLVYYEPFADTEAAIQREKTLKHYVRVRPEELCGFPGPCNSAREQPDHRQNDEGGV